MNKFEYYLQFFQFKLDILRIIWWKTFLQGQNIWHHQFSEVHKFTIDNLKCNTYPYTHYLLISLPLRLSSENSNKMHRNKIVFDHYHWDFKLCLTFIRISVFSIRLFFLLLNTIHTLLSKFTYNQFIDFSPINSPHVRFTIDIFWSCCRIFLEFLSFVS